MASAKALEKARDFLQGLPDLEYDGTTSQICDDGEIVEDLADLLDTMWKVRDDD